ncbi:MAG: hypothetical protein Q8Q25_03415 [bacterium]|nr:hypothetical protein [bacterium]
MNKKYTKSLLALVISLSLVTPAAQAGFAGKAAKTAYNGGALVGAAWLAWNIKGNAWTALSSRDAKGIIMSSFFYAALSKALASSVNGLVNTFNDQAAEAEENA